MSSCNSETSGRVGVKTVFAVAPVTTRYGDLCV